MAIFSTPFINTTSLVTKVAHMEPSIEVKNGGGFENLSLNLKTSNKWGKYQWIQYSFIHLTHKYLISGSIL